MGFAIGRRGRGAAASAVSLGLALVAVVPLAGAGTSAASPPTGQVDRSTTVRGTLRQDLLAASRGGGAASFPDPAATMVIRSTLRVGDTRVLLVAFRSLGGQRCLGVSLAGTGVPATPPECMPPCRATVCLVLFSGGSLPPATRILAGSASRTVDEISVAAPSGAVRRYRVSRSRIGAPAVAPILARVGGVRRVGAISRGRELAWVRFPA